MTVTGTAEKIIPGGETLVSVDGAAVLVANAVPGDLLQIQLESRRRGVERGKIIGIIEPSSQRVAAPCPVADQCGGCALQYISEIEQAIVKSAWVSDAFGALIDAATAWMPVHFCEGRFRRRVRWFVGADDQGIFLGFYAPTSHRPVRHRQCLVLTPTLNAVRQLLEERISLSGVNSVQAVQLDDGMHIILETGACPEGIELDQIDGLSLQWWWRDHNGITRPMKKQARSLHDLLPAGEAQVQLAVGPDDFVQGQRQGNCELISQLLVWAGQVNRIADLFCGIGNLSLPLAVATGAEVLAAELNAASVRAARHNAKMLDVSSSFVVANLFESFDMEPYIGADVLILDPPRRGAKRLCAQMSLLLPKRIIMASCDPATGARDGALLQQHGYRLKALRALDLFPCAGHVEAMSLWEPE